MTDETNPKLKPNFHWTVSKGEPVPPPGELISDGAAPAAENPNAAAQDGTASAIKPEGMETEATAADGEQLPGIKEEQPRRKSLRERNIIRLLELGDEAVQMRDYRMARKYYMEARDIFDSREALDRLRDLDKARMDRLRAMMPDSEDRRGRKGSRKYGRRSRKEDSGKRTPFRHKDERPRPESKAQSAGEEGENIQDTSGSIEETNRKRRSRAERPFRKDSFRREGGEGREGRSWHARRSERPQDRPGSLFGKFGRSFGGPKKRFGKPFGKKSFGKKPFAARKSLSGKKG